MKSAPSRSATRAITFFLAAAVLASCDTATEPSGGRRPSGPLAAKASAATGLTVTSTSPSFGRQGQVGETVTITGTGFEPGAEAAWVRNGVVDTTITVTSTQYVSPTTLIATINISPKSPVDFRDIQVTTRGRTQGIGSLMFEITQAIEIAGTSWVRSINDNGEATGTLSGGDGVFYYKVSTGNLETVSTTGTGYDISPSGTAIVGSGGPNGAFAYLYTRTGTGGTWQGTALPIGATSTGAVARAMRVDGAGQVVQIAGVEFGGPGPVTWTWQASTASWQRAVLPGGGEVRHRAIGGDGIVGGMAPIGRVLGPAVWMPNGGGYAVAVLAAANGAVNGVRSDGGMLVGFTSTRSSSTPLYWLAQPGGTWGEPIPVAGGCSGVKDVSDAGRFVLNDCPIGSGKQASVAYADAPYKALSRLGGLGPAEIPASVAGISHGGHYAGGYAYLTPQVSVGVYWTLPLSQGRD